MITYIFFLSIACIFWPMTCTLCPKISCFFSMTCTFFCKRCKSQFFCEWNNVLCYNCWLFNRWLAVFNDNLHFLTNGLHFLADDLHFYLTDNLHFFLLMPCIFGLQLCSPLGQPLRWSTYSSFLVLIELVPYIGWVHLTRHNGLFDIRATTPT